MKELAFGFDTKELKELCCFLYKKRGRKTIRKQPVRIEQLINPLLYYMKNRGIEKIELDGITITKNDRVPPILVTYEDYIEGINYESKIK